MVESVIIMGAAGRDFHNFNIYFKDNPRYQVIGFTAAQIPDIDGRQYPAELAGTLYPHGIKIYQEDQLAQLIRDKKVDLVAFSYSDVPHTEVMHKAAIAMAEGADFILIGATYTHPMPYGDLTKQVVQRFSSYEDLDNHQCTIEEREEYEPLIAQDIVVYAGIDYGRILEVAEKEADVIVWDGGNNDTPFYYPDIHIVLFDPHRAGHERLYYPGETNLLMADIALINKVDSAPAEQVDLVRENIATYAPKAEIVLAESAILVDHPEQIKGKRVLVVEDGPTLTHGGMSFGAGTIAARRYEADSVVDPRPYAVGSIGETYKRYPHLDAEVPAMGYSQEQMYDLELTINNAECDLVLFATPIDLPKLLSINKPSLRVHYEYQDHGSPTLEECLIKRLEALKK
jgi:predicted GTPase